MGDEQHPGSFAFNDVMAMGGTEHFDIAETRVKVSAIWWHHEYAIYLSKLICSEYFNYTNANYKLIVYTLKGTLGQTLRKSITVNL